MSTDELIRLSAILSIIVSCIVIIGFLSGTYLFVQAKDKIDNALSKSGIDPETLTVIPTTKTV